MARASILRVLVVASVVTGCGNSAGPTSSGVGGAAAQSTAAATIAASTASSGAGGGGGTGGASGAYGKITGTCGDIDLEDVESPKPELVENTLDFSGLAPFDGSQLSPGGKTMFSKGNLGGSSLYSEVFAYEVLYRCDEAEFVKAENEIVYAMNGKKTDLLVAIDGQKVGVSVVRALSYPEGAPYPVSQAYNVLHGKLADILQSSKNVAPQDAWKKQILAVIAQSSVHAKAIADAYAMVDATTKADTIVVVTTTEGEDKFIYYNK
jgi:hypothetical protein